VVHGLGVLERDDLRRRARVEADLERCLPGIGEQSRLELRIDPGPGDEPRAVRRVTRHEPIDPLAELLAGDDSLVDQPIGERADARRDRRIVQRLVVVVVAHSASSSQCSKTST
jgi:hypothetical protein